MEPTPCFSARAGLVDLEFVHLPQLFGDRQEPESPWTYVPLVNYSKDCFHFLAVGKKILSFDFFFVFLGTFFFGGGCFFPGMFWQRKETGFVLKGMEVLHSSAFHSGGRF